MKPWLAATTAYIVVTIVVTYPLAFVAGTHLSNPSDDPLLTTWILWWNSHVFPLTETWWNAPFFFPTTGVMALSELLIGEMPIATPVQWLSGNPVLAHNAAVFASFPLCGLSAHFLVHGLTRSHKAAFVAGIAYAFSPFRANEIGHIQMLSYYWAPLALAALHRYLHGRSRWLIVFAAATILQILCNGYSLFHLPILVGLWTIWFARSWRRGLAIALTLAASVAALLPILLKYRAVQGQLHLGRPIGAIREFSADVASLMSAPAASTIWGPILTGRESYGLFPGAVVLCLIVVASIAHLRRPVRATSRRNSFDIALIVLAVLCLMATASVAIVGPWSLGALSVRHGHKSFSIALLCLTLYGVRSARWRSVWQTRSVPAFYLLAAAVFYILAFGPEPTFHGIRVLYKAPYAWLLDLPGFLSIRAPDRFAVLSTLSIAVLAGLISAKYAFTLPRRRLIWLFLVAGIIAEGHQTSSFEALPSRGPSGSWPGSVIATIELPLDATTDAKALYRSIGATRPIVNGSSGYSPPFYAALAEALADGDVAVIKEFARLGSIGVAVDAKAPEAAQLEAALLKLDGATALDVSDGWVRFVVGRESIVDRAFGEEIAVRSMSSNRHAEEVVFLRDRKPATAWNSGNQLGSEEIQTELENEEWLDSARFQAGACFFGFPIELTIDTSTDGVTWGSVWRGKTAIAMVRAALRDPSDVVLEVFLREPVRARFVRMRQVGRSRGKAPWCIAELSLHRPPPTGR